MSSDFEGQLPDQTIDSAEHFFAAIREKSAMDPELVRKSVLYLEEEASILIKSLGADPSKRRIRAIFFTGAFLGLKISWHRFLIYLKAKDFEAKMQGQKGDV